MLTESHRALMYEIYQCTDRPETFAAPGASLGLLPVSINLTGTLRQRVDEAFEAINESEAKSARVEEILAEYKDLSIDPSRIERDGYSFDFEASMNRIKELLFPYTGIVAISKGDQVVNWG